MAERKLESDIRKLRCKNADSRYFVPQGQLRAIFDTKNNTENNTDNIKAALRANGIETHEITKTVDFILHRAQTIFAILLTIHEVDAITRFICNDQLQLQSLDQRLPYPEGSLKFLSEETADKFYEAQWEFAAPIFSHQFSHRDLDQFTIMPFTFSKFIGKGGFGHVFSLELHPKHHKLHHLEKDGVSVCLPLTAFFFLKN